MGITDRSYTYKDMEESMVSLSDPASHKKFLSTFQRQNGFPRASAESKKAVNFDVVLAHSDSHKCLLFTNWKLPQGAVTIAESDSAFASLLLQAYCQKHISEWNALGSAFGCDSCKKPRTKVWMNRSWTIERRTLKLSLSFVCNEGACCMKQMEQVRMRRNKPVGAERPKHEGIDGQSQCNPISGLA